MTKKSVKKLAVKTAVKTKKKVKKIIDGMKPEIKKLWVDALRSGKYKKTQRQLKFTDGDNNIVRYCCLGVLCDLHAQAKHHKWDGDVYFNKGGFLPEKVKSWAGLEEENPVVEYRDGVTSLIDLNDDLNYSFKKIADVIEKNL